MDECSSTEVTGDQITWSSVENAKFLDFYSVCYRKPVEDLEQRNDGHI